MPTSSASQFSKIFKHFRHVLGDKWKRRRGSLGPVQVFCTVMHMSVMGKKHYGEALTYVRNDLGDAFGWGDAPSPSAFSQARRKLTRDDCERVATSIMKLSRKARKNPEYRYKNHRLLAVDGTFSNLPSNKKLMEFFGSRCNQKPALVPSVGIVALWDIGANQPVGWDIQGANMDERKGARALFSHLQKGDLLIADRGYPAMDIFHEIASCGADFLIRMNTTSVAKTKELESFLRSKKRDAIYTFSPIFPNRGKRRWHGEDEMTIRFIKTINDKGQEQVWATSLLDAVEHKRETLIDLYRQRWKIETAFYESKEWHGIENFKARFVDGIYQEITAIFLFMYIKAELEVIAREQYFQQVKDGAEPSEESIHKVSDIKELPFRFNRKYVGMAVVGLMCVTWDKPSNLRKEWKYWMNQIWRYKRRSRKGRSYPRTCKSPIGKTKLRGRSKKSLDS